MKNIFIPTDKPEDWRKLLAKPDKHWAQGKSARTLAHCWEDAAGFPPEVQQTLAAVPQLAGITPLIIFPEWKVSLPGGGAASQNDLWILAKCDAGLVSLTIEGKRDESFGPKVSEWKQSASKGKLARLIFLSEKLGVAHVNLDAIYYQLLHRTAAAVMEAERFGASQAVMLVHSFSLQDKWFEAFAAFVSLYGLEVEMNTMVTTTIGNGLFLHLGWVQGDKRYLER